MQFYQFKAFLTKDKKNSDPFFCRYIYRPISLYIAWILQSLGISANQVTLSTIVISFIACLLFCSGNFINSVIASILFCFAGIADCVDGNIARANKRPSIQGTWLDAVSGYFIYAFLPISIGVFIDKNNPEFIFPGFWIMAGGLVSILNLFSRIIFQKYRNLISKISKKELNNNQEREFSIGNEIGLVGFMMPFLFITTISNNLNFYISFYLFIYSITSIYVFISINKKIKKYSKIISL